MEGTDETRNPFAKKGCPAAMKNGPCGSGKKAKKCCLNKIKALAALPPALREQVVVPRFSAIGPPWSRRHSTPKDRFTMRYAALLLILVLAGRQPEPPRLILVPAPRPDRSFCRCRCHASDQSSCLSRSRSSCR